MGKILNLHTFTFFIKLKALLTFVSTLFSLHGTRKQHFFNTGLNFTTKWVKYKIFIFSLSLLSTKLCEFKNGPDLMLL